MAPRSITPRDQDRPFECDELFFSTTDAKGIIRSGNDVFVRVSGYTISELLGKPHNIIRHPDMPCAVFKLLWDYLGQGKSFAGYVKNMAADGCRYWVMALAVPIPQGYLSVRFKPSSAFLSVAKDIYTEMRGIELAAGDTVAAHRSAMQRSAERLMAVLKDKGFADYDSFMHTALAAEMAQHRDAIAARGRQGLTSPAFASAMCHVSASADELEAMLQAAVTIDRLLDDLFSRVASFLDLIKRLDGKSEFLLELARDIRLISFNAVTTSYRLDQSGRGLTVVTHNLATIMEESTQVITQMTRQISALTSSLREMAFSITSAKLQVEMTIFFLQELLRAKKQGKQPAGGAADLTRTRDDVSILVGSFSVSTQRMLDTLPHVQEPLRPLVLLQEQLSEIFRKLNVVRVTGKVQASYIAEATRLEDLFDGIFKQLQVAQGELHELSSGIRLLDEHVPRFQMSGTAVKDALCAFGSQVAT